MSDRPFRFIHAGDFHLERPLYGLSEVPDHLRDLLVDAPYRAAQRVFDTALSASVDFVVLSGDLLNVDLTGVRGPLFLIQQFQRLAAQNIQVFWVAGQIDAPDTWAKTYPLPSNVHVFSRARPDELSVERNGVSLAHITGLSYARRQRIRSDEFWPSADGQFMIVATHGEVELDGIAQRGINYWALGSLHERATPMMNPTVVHYPGTPQGRCQSEHGAHGCTLVDVVPGVTPRLQFFPTDVVRFVQQRMHVDPSTTRDQLQKQLEQKIDELTAAQGNVDLLVEWSIGGHGPLLKQLRGVWGRELLNRLRQIHGRRTPSVWSIHLDVQPDSSLGAELLDQDTLLGEYMRAIERHLTGKTNEHDCDLSIAPYLGDHATSSAITALLNLSTPDTRQRVLREAAIMGTDLLSGERT